MHQMSLNREQELELKSGTPIFIHFREFMQEIKSQLKTMMDEKKEITGKFFLDWNSNLQSLVFQCPDLPPGLAENWIFFISLTGIYFESAAMSDLEFYARKNVSSVDQKTLDVWDKLVTRNDG